MRFTTKFICLCLTLSMFGCSAITKLAGAGASEVQLTLQQIDPSLGEFGSFFGIDDGNGIISYTVINEPAYDKFFEAAARLNGLVIICKEMSSKTTEKLKSFARTRYAKMAGNADIKELIGDTPEEEWTSTQSLAVMNASREMSSLNVDEIKYFLQTAGAMKAASVSLGKGVVQAGDLLKKGKKLMEEVSNLKPLMVPKATAGVKKSLENLKSVADNAPVMAEELLVLAKALTKLK